MRRIPPASEALRIAIVSTCAVSTPPRAYGGTELVLAELARALTSLGHRPTVFATGDSRCAGARACAFARPVWPPEPFAELRHASAAFREIARGDFDVVHVNQAEALAFTPWVDVPAVATVHHERVPALATHYAAYPEVAFVAISRRQAELSPDIPLGAVIHHGLNPDAYPEGDGGGGYFAFLGRFSPAKAPHLAIDAAARARVPLRLGGEAHPPERAYFVSAIEPRLGGGATWLGELDHAGKVELLRGARALLFPIQWEEPFGLVMIESMLVGTPVIGFRSGSVPEVIEEGVTGFVVDTLEELVARIADVRSIDRDRCRARARQRWCRERMAHEYVELYRTMVDLHQRRARRLRA
jgi:glycosyltransferase involved in cell wall biosynthesis